MKCGLHNSQLSLKCNAAGQGGRGCANKSVVFPAGYLPICKQHVYLLTPAGRCQAIEGCGQRCSRLSVADPPFHLCTKHQKGTDTLPCYLMKIPTEIRLEILRYILPAKIPDVWPHRNKNSHGIEWKYVDSVWSYVRNSRYPDDNWSGSGGQRESFARHELNVIKPLFQINRQINEEAATILYGETPFQVTIYTRMVKLLNQIPFQVPDSTFGHLGPYPYAIVTIPVLKRIRNFEIAIRSHPEDLDVDSGWGLTPDLVSNANFDLYELRDTIRRFIELIHQSNCKDHKHHVKSIELKPLEGVHTNLRLDEILAFIAMVAEPFKALGKISKPVLADVDWGTVTQTAVMGVEPFSSEYSSYQTEWQDRMSQMSGLSSKAHGQALKSTIIKASMEFQKIENFLGVIHKSGLTEGSFDSGDSPPFGGATRVLDLARMAHEQFDLEALAEIRKAITRRWIDHDKQQRQRSRNVAESLLEMLTSDEASQATHDHPNQLSWPQQKEDTVVFDDEWSELDDILYSMHELIDEERATITEDRERRYYTKGDKVYVRLKTPRFVSSTATSSHYHFLTAFQIRRVREAASA